MDVVVVGSCMIDLVSYVSRLPRLGETLHGSKFIQGFGGKGANQCVMASRLGAKTAMVAKVGTDSFGHSYIQNFKENAVNVDYVCETSEASTGVAPITVTQDGGNSIVIVAGANLLLSEADVHQAESMVRDAKVLVCQLETTPETTLAALKLARKHSVTSILNPAPAVEKLDAEVYKNCDIFCPNEHEAALLTGKPVRTLEEAYVAIATLLGRGCRTAMITMGEKGVVYATLEHPTPMHVDVQPVTPVDTTGAGDAFVGSLAYYLACMPSLGLHEYVRRASAIATLSVQAEGTQTSYPQRNDIPHHLLHD